MAIPITNIPVLTGDVAERFIQQSEYNARHLRGSQWTQEGEATFKAIKDKYNRTLEELKRRGLI